MMKAFQAPINMLTFNNLRAEGEKGEHVLQINDFQMKNACFRALQGSPQGNWLPGFLYFINSYCVSLFLCLMHDLEFASVTNLAFFLNVRPLYSKNLGMGA